MRGSRREILSAIRAAAKESVLFKGSSLTDGLRAIREFERINGCEFDAGDDYHRSLVAGMGCHMAIKRRVDRIWRHHA